MTADLTNCDREPIHIPGLIQPHGALLVFQESTLVVTQVSRNLFEMVGCQPQDVLGQSLVELLGAEQVETVRRCLAEDFESVNPLKLALSCQSEARAFDGIIHRNGGAVLLELEPQTEGSTGNFLDFYQQVHGTVTRLQKATTLQDMCEAVVNDIRRITGFDRVMVYQFDPDYAGSVIAEATDQDTAYLGLRYPASDIPKQARHLYTLNWLRLIPDASYEPVGLLGIESEDATGDGAPLDLSFAVLRSVSPLHTEYMQNMGVAASMSISLMQGRKLWGLIACHHTQPKHVSYDIRTACQFVGQVMSAELANKEASEVADYRMHLKLMQTEMVNTLSESETFVAGILQLGPSLLDVAGATGAAVFSDGECTLVGETPTEQNLRALLEWIRPRMQQSLFETHCLSEVYPPAEDYKAIASGLLALEISPIHHNFILWFRPEVVHTVNWGGDPTKTRQVLSDGSVYLTPRKSFDRWKETVRGCSRRWQPAEREAVLELRNLIVGLVLRQADELASINFELKRSNDELDSFAYIASHDLKEPLRGIHNYANFLMEDYEDILDDSGVSKLQTLVRLTQRMEDLLNSLLHFSRIGRAELVRQLVDLDALVRQSVALLDVSRPQNDFKIHIPRPLPKVNGDRSQINELFTNLISNATKYNDKPKPWVEIGYIDPTRKDDAKLAQNLKAPHDIRDIVFYIRDNGIGISPDYFERIFQIFRRLHGRDSYGGGTGVGLTIVQKIIERHSGTIWVDSTLDEGSTFYFTLEGQEDS